MLAFFVWEWLVDPNNPNGEQHEGTRCRERMLGGDYYCARHMCDACKKPVVGVSGIDAHSAVDERATGVANPELYSNFCATHKCMSFLCKKARISLDNTIRILGDGRRVESPVYCDEHCRVCNVWNGSICGNDVEQNATYKVESPRQMICLECRGARKNSYVKIGKCKQCHKMGTLVLGGNWCSSCRTKQYQKYAGDLARFIIYQKMLYGGNSNLDEITPSTAKHTGLLGTITVNGENIYYNDVYLYSIRDNGSKGLASNKAFDEAKFFRVGWDCSTAAFSIAAMVDRDSSSESCWTAGYGTRIGLQTLYNFEIDYNDPAMQDLIERGGGAVELSRDLNNLQFCDVTVFHAECESLDSMVDAGVMENVGGGNVGPSGASEVFNDDDLIMYNTFTGDSPNHTTFKTDIEIDCRIPSGRIPGAGELNFTNCDLFVSYGHEQQFGEVRVNVEYNDRTYSCEVDIDENGNFYAASASEAYEDRTIGGYAYNELLD